MVKVVGYYGYSKTDSANSNEITKTIQVDGIAQVFTVAFNSNGGNDIAAVQVNDGERILLPKPTKEGATFDGWYTDEALTTPFTALDKVHSDLVLYAKWI